MRTVDWLLIAVVRMIGWMLAALTLGQVIGSILGKRHVKSYVHEFLDSI